MKEDLTRSLLATKTAVYAKERMILETLQLHLETLQLYQIRRVDELKIWPQKKYLMNPLTDHIADNIKNRIHSITDNP